MWRGLCQTSAMYKAIHKSKRFEVVILEPGWADRIDEVRKWDRADLLVCQECQQPVRLRAGQYRAWHFAHKHRQNCTIGNESPQLLKARAQLYRWLVGKFGTERVTVEKKVPESELKRPIDCWVSGEKNIAYWIFEAGIKPQNREIIQKELTQPDIVPQWVFLATMLRQDEDEPEHIHLTTTEREFAQNTDFDLMFHQQGQSLHYLDNDTEQMTTYRGLHLVHRPQVYSGKPIVHALADVMTLKNTGDFIHPGEYDILQAYKEEQRRLEEEQKREEKRLQEEQRRLAKLRRQQELERKKRLASTRSVPRFTTLTPENFPASKTEKRTPSQESSYVVHVGNDWGICEFCGEKTKDWWFFDGKTGMCKCRKCRREGRS